MRVTSGTEAMLEGRSGLKRTISSIAECQCGSPKRARTGAMLVYVGRAQSEEAGSLNGFLLSS